MVSPLRLNRIYIDQPSNQTGFHILCQAGAAALPNSAKNIQKKFFMLIFQAFIKLELFFKKDSKPLYRTLANAFYATKATNIAKIAIFLAVLNDPGGQMRSDTRQGLPILERQGIRVQSNAQCDALRCGKKFPPYFNNFTMVGGYIQ